MTSFFPEPPPAPVETADDAAPTEPFVPGGRLHREDHAHNTFANAGPPVHLDPEPRSRWAKSATSFGPVGRIVASMMVLAFGAYLLTLGIGAPIAIFMWWFVVTPKLMFDIWKQVRVHGR